MSNWLVDKLIPSIMRSETQKSSVPEGLWHKCPSCEAVLYRPELEKTLDVCPKCQHHMRIDARTRLDIFLDADGREEIAAELEPVDRLKFRDSKKYKDRLTAAQKQTGEKDALVAMSGKLVNIPVVACAFEFSFMGGSMGAIVGERFVRAANVALEKRCPLVCFSASGGARMQEALISLMQMAKTSAVLARMRDLRADRSGIRWGLRELGNARRRDRRGAEGLDWFRRPSSNRANRAGEAAGGLPA